MRYFRSTLTPPMSWSLHPRMFFDKTILQGCTTSLRPRAENSRLAGPKADGEVLGSGSEHSSPPAAMRLCECSKLLHWGPGPSANAI